MGRKGSSRSLGKHSPGKISGKQFEAFKSDARKELSNSIRTYSKKEKKEKLLVSWRARKKFAFSFVVSNESVIIDNGKTKRND